MADVDGPQVADSSQSVDRVTFVGDSGNVSGAGFREAFQKNFGADGAWEVVESSGGSKSHKPGAGKRITRQATSGLQQHDNSITKIDGDGPDSQGGRGGGAGLRQGGGGDGGGGGQSGNADATGGGSGDSGGGGGGPSGNGGDPHPGRPVGSGGPRGSPSASTGASALLAKLFTEPLRDPVPSGTQFLPCNTEEVTSEREGKGTQYSPVMWADPLIPVNITVGSTHSAIDHFPGVGVSVNNRLEAQEPMLTEQGLMLKSIVDTEANPTLLRSMMPVKGMKDVSALICLMESSRRTGIQAMTDEAPLIRLGLLMHCLAPVEWMAYTTSCVQNMDANGYADVSGATRTWTSAPSNTTSTQIGTDAGASNLYWRTLSQYSRLVSGSAISSDILYDSKQDEVSVEKIKFIPVKMSWRGQSWLGPYILAHTTTKWWNHAVSVTIPVKVHDQKTATNKAKVSCIPKAATVYVPGSYQFISLVIVDVVEASEWS